MSNECEELKKFDKEDRQTENCAQSHLQQIDNRFFKLESELNSIKTMISNQKTGLSKLNNENCSSYANIVENSNYSLVIKPMSKEQSSADTKNDLKQFVKPEEVKVAISRVISTKDGGVVIRCNNEKEVNFLKEVAAEKLGAQYQLAIPNKKLP
ncbi:hypothetical protein WA026_022079 [Henosepilachna vigintioctopunctata]|uniref:Uncharacterized protein n=1 Tax=Henosepilachna vigintioctopunctata TaxID=420089 RepID=A0AAW1UCU7_9CUCU